MLNRAESRGLWSTARRWARKTPSNVPPIRWIAFRDRWFRTSVCRQTERTRHTSKAWASISRFISVFAPVRSASRASQV
jgi:hypothetical protein